MIRGSRPFVVALVIIILVLGIIALPLSVREYLACSEPNIENGRTRTVLKFYISFELGLVVLFAIVYAGILLKEFVFPRSG